MARIPPIMSGARAKVSIVVPNANQARPVGIFASLSYSRGLSAEPSYILGRMSAASQQYTAADVVSVRASGWRAISNDAHKVAGFPSIQDMLTSDYLQMTVVDRVTGLVVCTFKDGLCLADDSAFTAKQLSEITIPYQFLLMDTETTINAEPADASSLP